ncbi:9217_t:CDS:10, partial [Paraglomus occultum]
MSGFLSPQLFEALQFPVPGISRHVAHATLAAELKVLKSELPISSVAYQRMSIMKTCLETPRGDCRASLSQMGTNHTPRRLSSEFIADGKLLFAGSGGSATYKWFTHCNLESTAFNTGIVLSIKKVSGKGRGKTPPCEPVLPSMKQTLEDEPYPKLRNFKMRLLDVNSVRNLSFDDDVSCKDSEWKLSSGKLVAEILASSTMKALETSKKATKKPDAFVNSIICLGLSCIVDLDSEFSNGMHMWFGNEWTALKEKVYEHVNIVPKPFDGNVKEVIDQIDMVYSNNYNYQNGQRKRLTEMEFVLKMRGETETKCTSTPACRKINMRIVHQAHNIELSHTECAQSPAPMKAVHDCSKLLRTNKCVLDKYLMENIPMDTYTETTVFDLQVAGLDAQLIGIDIFDYGLYFGLEGASFSFPSQLTQITILQRALEVLYFFKDNIKRKAIALPDPVHSINPGTSKPKHYKASFIKPTFFTPEEM